jgi:hypothetical protein
LWLTLLKPAGLIYIKRPEQKRVAKWLGNAAVGSVRNVFAVACPRAVPYCSVFEPKHSATELGCG